MAGYLVGQRDTAVRVSCAACLLGVGAGAEPRGAVDPQRRWTWGQFQSVESYRWLHYVALTWWHFRRLCGSGNTKRLSPRCLKRVGVVTASVHILLLRNHTALHTILGVRLESIHEKCPVQRAAAHDCRPCSPILSTAKNHRGTLSNCRNPRWVRCWSRGPEAERIHWFSYREQQHK